MQVQDVEVIKVKAQVDHELSENFYRVCGFCNKIVMVTSSNFQSCTKLSKGQFHCPLCLRHNHQHRSSRNILILSFRAIAGYYYYRFYVDRDTSPWLFYIKDIERHLDRHISVGMQNPIFVYDPDTMLWFVDFNRIGNDKHKAPFDEVLSTIEKILDSFDVEEYLDLHTRNNLWYKFEKAATLFHQKRQRPTSRRPLIPTLARTGTSPEKEEFWEQTRVFVRSQLILK